MFDISDPNSFMGSLASVQGLPGAAQLDMNVSCLFMHEVRIIKMKLFKFFFSNDSVIFHFSYDININMVNMKT